MDPRDCLDLLLALLHPAYLGLVDPHEAPEVNVEGPVDTGGLPGPKDAAELRLHAKLLVDLSLSTLLNVLARVHSTAGKAEPALELALLRMGGTAFSSTRRRWLLWMRMPPQPSAWMEK